MGWGVAEGNGVSVAVGRGVSEGDGELVYVAVGGWGDGEGVVVGNCVGASGVAHAPKNTPSKSIQALAEIFRSIL